MSTKVKLQLTNTITMTKHQTTSYLHSCACVLQLYDLARGYGSHENVCVGCRLYNSLDICCQMLDSRCSLTAELWFETRW